MFDILQFLPRYKRSPNGWVRFNAVCCEHNNETRDKRGRGGVIVTADGWTYKCFNCNFKTSYRVGRTLHKKTRDLLTWLGVPDDIIRQYSLDTLKRLDEVPEYVFSVPEFHEIELPDTKPLTDQALEYLTQRSINPTELEFKSVIIGTRPGILIPYWYQQVLVGYGVRFLDKLTPKYMTSQQPGFVFGLDYQQEHWTHAIVAEGILDAVSVNGIALGHNFFGPEQLWMLRRLNKTIVVVPDHDRAGLQLITQAQREHFEVSVPEWPKGIKDINDAVREYGRLATIVSIMSNRTQNPVKIKLAKKYIESKC